MKFAFLQNNRLRLGLVTLIFSVSVATVILVRATSPVLLGYDTCALVESAVRFSKTGVASSAMFPGFTEVITDPHPYPELRWWATGAPKLMGTLIRLSLSPEAAFRAVNYAAIALMWLGWFLVVKEADRLELLSRHPLVAAGFCLCPLFLTPFIDIDEMLFAAFVPWIIWLTGKTLSSRKWWLYLCLLLLAFWAGYQVRHVSLMFPLLAISAFGIVLLRKQETKLSKTKALLSLLSSMGIFLLLLYLNSSTSPDYFHDQYERKKDIIGRFIEAVKYSGYTSLFWTVNWFMPGRLVSLYEERLMSWQVIGFFSLPLFCLVAAFVTYKSLHSKMFAGVNFTIFSEVLVLLINYAVLIYASIKNQGEFIYTGFAAYWYPYLPLVIILPIFLFGENLKLRSAFARAVGVISLLSLATMIMGVNNKALSQLRGFHFDGQEMLKQRLSFVQLSPADFVLPQDLLQAEAIFYTRTPHFYWLMYPDSRLQFRPPPSRRELLRYRTTSPVTIYMSLFDTEREKNFMGLGMLHVVMPRTEKVSFDEVFADLTLVEMNNVSLSEFIVIWFYNMHLVKVELPAGWRGKYASE